MAEYKILLKPSAAKEIEAVGSKEDRRRIVEKISALAWIRVHPKPRNSPDMTTGIEFGKGIFRIVYLIDDSRREITIFKVGHRKDVYR